MKLFGIVLSLFVWSLPALSVEVNGLSLEPKAKLTYIDFWASWCPPCLKSFPHMNHLYDQFNARGLHIVAINVDEKTEQANRFVEKMKPKFNIIFDQNHRLVKTFGIKAMPSSYLVDNKGKIFRSFKGYNDQKSLEIEKAIDQYLNKL